MSDVERFRFPGLFIFEMANNHQGSVEHGLAIIRAMGDVARRAGVRGAIKLQFRDLDTFIHPAHRAGTSNRHIQRFLSTRLTRDEFAALVAETRAQGLVTMCTPFDEPSVDFIQELDVEVIKVGSCSAKDWPLLEAVAAAGRPVIVSTGGLTLADVDNMMSFLDHRYVHFALMHCVARYPTPVEDLRLERIALMRDRYPGVPIGFSTHEDPANAHIIMMAHAKGARLFERHVGLRTERIALNAYSSTPEQIEAWLAAYQEAVVASGGGDPWAVDPGEAEELRLLMRGVYAARPLTEGEPLGPEDVFFAMPLQPGQLTSGQWRETLVADRSYAQGEAIAEALAAGPPSKKQIIYQAIHEVKGMLNAARVVIGTEFTTELSHHYGVERFRDVGIVIIDCINREYCKKILVQLPGQQHPYHHHKRKEETFQVLVGELDVEIEGRHKRLYPGDTLLIQRGVRHRFWSEHGAIFEEISTTNYDDDSIYEDPVINTTPREERKTRLVNWGRHQFD